MITRLLLFSLILSLACINAYVVNPGPTYVPTKGYVWPRPANQTTSDEFYTINPTKFEFSINGTTCNLLYNAFRRYKEIMQFGTPTLKSAEVRVNEDSLGVLTSLFVVFNGTCRDDAYPTVDMDEQYDLSIPLSGAATLTSNSIWGILRGLETFSQILYIGSDGITVVVNSTSISDWPRYSHRGVLLDTSRHFIPLAQIKTIIDSMAYNKLNVFHWHIVDDQSFPYVSLEYPLLSQLGAYHPQLMVYSPDDVSSVIEYARQRGIRVIPEFDTPGHTRSWGVAYPELLTECNSVSAGAYGPMDPTKNFTYSFIEGLFTEVRSAFKDQYIHLGGDEVDFDCWQADENITKFMTQNNITTYENVEAYFIKNIIDIADKLNFSSIVWEEVFKNGVIVPNETVIHIWIDSEEASWKDTLYNVTHTGHVALLSACWYLDHLSSGGDWKDFYACEPSSFGGDADQQKLVLGGEACMWAEVVNQYNVVQRIFPRASAPAEILWSPYESSVDMYLVARRLEEHVCRMNKRGVPAQPPNSAGFCI